MLLRGIAASARRGKEVYPELCLIGEGHLKNKDMAKNHGLVSVYA